MTNISEIHPLHSAREHGETFTPTADRVYDLVTDIKTPQFNPTNRRIQYLIGGNTMADLILGENNSKPLSVLTLSNSIHDVFVKERPDIVVINAPLLDVRMKLTPDDINRLTGFSKIATEKDTKSIAHIRLGYLLANGLIQQPENGTSDPSVAEIFKPGSPLRIEDADQVKELIELVLSDPVNISNWEESIRFALNRLPLHIRSQALDRYREIENEIASR